MIPHVDGCSTDPKTIMPVRPNTMMPVAAVADESEHGSPVLPELGAVAEFVLLPFLPNTIMPAFAKVTLMLIIAASNPEIITFFNIFFSPVLELEF